VLEFGTPVTDVARRYGVARQTVHEWIRRYEADGATGLEDRSSKPANCPHQTPADIEARIVSLRRAHPRWGPGRIVTELAHEGVDPVPGQSSVYRALVRHGLTDSTAKRGDTTRRPQERGERVDRSMQLWQLDVGKIRLADGMGAVIAAIDDYSRFCVGARVVQKARVANVAGVFSGMLRHHGQPNAVVTSASPVFVRPADVATRELTVFDRICNLRGIRHVVAAPYVSPTVSKVTQFQRLMRREVFDVPFATVPAAQRALDRWIHRYNHDTPLGAIGGLTPVERFARARVQSRAYGFDVDPGGKLFVGDYGIEVGEEVASQIVALIGDAGTVEFFDRGIVIARD
jgi:transposase InsO family protein